MAIQFGNDKIKEIYYGSDRIKEIYYGSELVWDGTVGYWVHKDTGVKTYFGLDDPSISGSVMYTPSWRYDCSEVRIPYGVTELFNGCFSNCTSLTSIIIPKSVTRLDGLDGCTALASINIPESVTIIDDYCFAWCTSFTSINIPKNVTYVGTYCFRDCSSLISINIPAGITSLKNGCFWGCTSLTSIDIPEGVTSLGNTGFRGCTSLTSINIPENVTKIDNYCFDGCSSLTLITVLPATPPFLGIDVFNNVHTSFSIKVPSASVNAYKTAPGWSTYASKISAI